MLNTCRSYTRLRFNSKNNNLKYQKEAKEKTRSKHDLLSKGRYCNKTHTLLMKRSGLPPSIDDSYF